MNLYTVETGRFKLDGGAMFGVVPKAIWSRTNPSDSNNLCSWAMRSLLVEDGDRLILIDTGLGDKQTDKFFSYYYLHGDDSLTKSLNKLGFGVDDITDVILTHLHFDHVGGAIVRDQNGNFKPTFKNATYWSNQKHWDWAVNPNPREKASFLSENILPISESGQLKFIQTGKEFGDDIDFLVVNGHTESQMIPKIKYKNQTVVFMADLLPSVGHIPLPYVMGFDVRPLDTLKEKDTFFKEAILNDYTLFLQHDPVNICCKLKSTDKGARLDKVFDLTHL